MKEINRRKFITYGSASILPLVFNSAAIAKTKAITESGLADTFKDKFHIGTAISTNTLENNNSRLLKLIAREFNTITAENDMKWEMIRPSLDKWNWKLADKFVDFGRKNQMLMVGHALVWHAQIPNDVFFENSRPRSKKDLLKIMKDHIVTMVDRYRNSIAVWDVVNEAVDNDKWRRTNWFKYIGSEYFEKAFQYAREADPSAHLIYNDYGMDSPSKQDFLLDAIRRLKSKGIRIDGVGMQLHAALDGPSARQIEDAIVKFAKAGLQVHITEMDLDVLPKIDDYSGAEISTNYSYNEQLNPYVSGLPEKISKLHTKRYTELFEVFVRHSDKVARVSTWGTIDSESWKNGWPVKGRTNYPLLFDRNYQPKEAYHSIKSLVQ